MPDGGQLQPVVQPEVPFPLLASAIAQGVKGSELEKLMDLQERWQSSRAEQEFNAAMNRCQQRMPVVVREKVNVSTNSKYAPLEAVNAVIRPIYTEEGFSLSFGTEESKLAGHVRVACYCRHTGGHSTHVFGDFPYDAVGLKGNANKTQIQAMGSSITYARRYLTLMIFNIAVADEDTDGSQPNQVINADQVGEINAMIEDCEKAGKPVDFAKFLKWLGVSGLHELPAKSLFKAIHFLNRKRREGTK